MNRPRILLPMNFQDAADGTPARVFLNDAYVRLVLDAGGLPILAPPGDAFDPRIAAMYDPDALLLTGGADLDPAGYGQPPHPKRKALHPRREAAELAWFAWADRADRPILGICLGCQVINVGRGGSLIQHLGDREGLLDHGESGRDGFHEVALTGGSLRDAVGAETVRTNSRHRQAVDRLGRGLRVVGRTGDGVTEAIEDGGGRFVVGVQWHPEDLPDDRATRAMAAALINAARRGRAR